MTEEIYEWDPEEYTESIVEGLVHKATTEKAWVFRILSGISSQISLIISLEISSAAHKDFIRQFFRDVICTFLQSQLKILSITHQTLFSFVGYSATFLAS